MFVHELLITTVEQVFIVLIILTYVIILEYEAIRSAGAQACD